MNKQITRYTAWILTIGVLTISACKKDDKNGGGTTPTPTPTTSGSRQITKIEESTGAYSAFDYNADGLINKIESRENGEVTNGERHSRLQESEAASSRSTSEIGGSRPGNVGLTQFLAAHTRPQLR